MGYSSSSIEVVRGAPGEVRGTAQADVSTGAQAADERTHEAVEKGARSKLEKRKVVTIPPTVSRFTASPIVAPKKRKVAAYARVSTDSDEQFTSYAAQIDYYTQFIKPRDAAQRGISFPGLNRRAPPDPRRSCRPRRLRASPAPGGRRS